jgi:hypothetical protein
VNRQRTLLACLFATVIAIPLISRDSTADEYVWARNNGGIASINRPVSAMNNGYGGYYVPRNAYGNNYEGQPIMNPTGYVIPAQPEQPARPSHWSRFKHWWCHR